MSIALARPSSSLMPTTTPGVRFVHALEDGRLRGAESPTFADALARLDGFAYDGLVVDVRLPGGDGLDVLDEALSRYPTMRCVVDRGLRQHPPRGAGAEARRRRLPHQAVPDRPSWCRS